MSFLEELAQAVIEGRVRFVRGQRGNTTTIQVMRRPGEEDLHDTEGEGPEGTNYNTGN